MGTELAPSAVGEPPSGSGSTAPVLAVSNLSKTFPGQQALDRVSIELYPGEVHALLGTNGSGKSTLIKVLTGVVLSDPGAVVDAGGSAGELIRGGLGGDINGVPIRCVHQDLGLVDTLSVMDNIAFADGFQRSGVAMLSWSRQAGRARELLATLEAEHIDVRAPVGEISPVDRTKVAIARVLGSWGESKGLLILDEPTATLGDEEVNQLFRVVRGVRASGHAVLYVTHRLAEVFDLADRVTVLRQARVVHSGEIKDLDRRGLVTHMLGHELVEYEHGSEAGKKLDGPERLRVSGLTVGVITDLSFSVREGEILGFAGLAGSGQEDIPPALLGAIPADGTLEANGAKLPLARMTPGKAWESGFAYLPPDRKRQGIVAGWPVRENTTFPIIDRFRRFGLLRQGKMTAAALAWAERVNLEPRDPMRPVQLLSGGNQNKVLVARCLATEPKILLLSEPTAGVDVGAREQIWDLVRQASRAGLSVVVSSTDTADLAALCDRVLVLRQGTVYAELQAEEINDRQISQSVLASHS